MVKDDLDANAEATRAKRQRSGTGLTVREIESAKVAPGERLVLVDGKVPGLHVRVTGTAKVFAIWLRIGRGRAAPKVLWTIGPVGDAPLEEVRRKARALADQAREGIDPRRVAEEARQKAAEEKAASLTLAQLVEKYIDARARALKPDTVREYRRILGRYLADSDVGKRPVVEIKRFHVREHVDRLAEEHGEGTARAVRRIIKTSTAWGADEEYVPLDPVAGLKHSRGGVRERVLSDDEITRFWASLERSPVEVRCCMRLQLLLGLRFPSECLPAIWSEVDEKARALTVPGARRKGKAEDGGGATLVLPLSAPALEVLDELRRVTGKGARLFGQVRRRSAVDYYWKRDVRPAVGGEVPITPHDLRRSCASGIVRLGFVPGIADAVLGHAVPGVGRHYIHTAPLPEMSRALEAWGRHVASLVGRAPATSADVLAFPS
jgi:integrase